MPTEMIKTIRGLGVAALGGTLLLGTALPAHAEGSFSASISNWATGKKSRSWTDKNSDGTRTAVAMSRCSGNTPVGASGTINLYREVRLRPDPKYGERNFTQRTCGGSRVAKGTWGDQTKGKYHFTLVRIYGMSSPPSWYRFSAGSVRVHY